MKRCSINMVCRGKTATWLYSIQSGKPVWDRIDAEKKRGVRYAPCCDACKDAVSITWEGIGDE